MANEAATGKYVCIRTCYHRARMYRDGDTYTPIPGETNIPKHFQPVGGSPAKDDYDGQEEAETMSELQQGPRVQPVGESETMHASQVASGDPVMTTGGTPAKNAKRGWPKGRPRNVKTADPVSPATAAPAAPTA